MCSGDNRGKMLCAVHYLANTQKGVKINSRLYEKLKIQRSIYQRTNEKWKNNISISAKRRFSQPENNVMYGKRHTEKSRKKMSSTRKERASDPSWNIRPPCRPETAEKIRQANLGRKWIYLPENNSRLYLPPEQIDYYLNQGWKLGFGPRPNTPSKHNLGKRWITDGDKNILADLPTQESMIAKGWRFGRCL
jgi:hypothetical protein